MGDYDEKNLNLRNDDDDNIDIERLSDNSSNDDNVDNSQNSSNLGLDLLVNSKKMMPVVEDKENHEEIDLIDDNNDKKHESSEKDSSEKQDSSEDDEEDNSNNNSTTYFPNKKHESETYQPKNPEPTLEDIIEKKKQMLYEFERLKKRGIPISKNFTLASNLDEMNFEYERVKKMRETENSVMFSRKMLMAFVTAVEFLNNRFDPFELKLDGWSEQVHEGINEYDDIFEELHEKYKSTGKVSPEIKLMLTLGGSAFMFHLTNNIFKSSMPQFENMAQQNPGMINEMMNKSSGARTVPQIFIGDHHVGGNRELQTLEREGKLNTLLEI